MDTEQSLSAGVLHLAKECYTLRMPTTRPRHMITETDDLASALDAADRMWPECQGQRSALLRKLIDAGINVVTLSDDNAQRARQEAIHAAAGSMSGLWPKNWREQMRSEWPD